MSRRKIKLSDRYRSILGAVTVPVLIWLAAVSGVLSAADEKSKDIWYQNGRDTNPDIVIVGIDERALQELGPFQEWGRTVMGEVLEQLNREEAYRPAVIGVDVLFAGAADGQTDERLALAAGTGNNVVMACAAQYGSALVEQNADEFYMDDFAVLGFEEPYEALKQATVQGHINAMMDEDGVLRHVLSEVRLEDGSRIPSFSAAIAGEYAKRMGQPLPKLPPVDAKGFWYLPFSGRPGDYDENISIVDILNETVAPEYFADKIVLIGPFAAGMNDQYYTSSDHAVNMYGVEYQANAIAALLAGNAKREPNQSAGYLLLGVILILSSFWMRHRKLLPAALFSAAVAGGWLVLCRLLYAAGIVMPLLWVPVGTAVLFIYCVGTNYLRAAVEKYRVTSTFKRYVAPEIVNEILKEGRDSIELGGHLCDIAVLFVDIRGFTVMSEALGPQTVVEILNRYLTLTSSCIMKHQGTLDKFVGDCTMAFWGAPLPQEDYVMNAVRAAVDMAEGSRELARQLQERYGRSVSFGIGIHKGPAVVGNIGAPNRMDYTAIGDTVNTASRLESNAPGGTIYISREVADALEGRIETTSLGNSIRLKGKKEGFEVLILDGICEDTKQAES